MLQIVLPNRTTFEPNETIDLMIAWSLEKTPQSLELRLVWNTVGRGTQNLEIAHTEVFHPDAESGQERLKLTLPAGPYSCQGIIVSVLWGIELVVLPSEQSTREEIIIGPGGKSVQLKSYVGGEAMLG
jgi:hypothetical protein